MLNVYDVHPVSGINSVYIHANIHTYIHTDRQTDRQTDIYNQYIIYIVLKIVFNNLVAQPVCF